MDASACWEAFALGFVCLFGVSLIVAFFVTTIGRFGDLFKH